MVESAKPDRSRKRPRNAPTHVLSWPLRPDRGQVKVLEGRLRAGTRVYNACLAEALRRSSAVRADPAFTAALLMPRATPKQVKARAIAFAAVESVHGFGKFPMNSYASSLRQSWVREQVFAQEAQNLGKTAFTAVSRFHYGQGGRPRFRPVAARPIRSLSSSDNCGSLRPVVDADGTPTHLQFGRGFLIPFAPAGGSGRAGRERKENFARLTDHIASGRVLYSGIVRTVVNGRPSWRASFTIDGNAPVRHPVGTQKMSLDLGPSQVAVAALDPATGGSVTTEFELAPGIRVNAARLRLLQRRYDRQHRAGSPACFTDDGTHIRGACLWTKRSNRSRTTRTQIQETHRRVAETRRTEHGRLGNQLVAGFGAQISTEKLNYVSWQKNFPRSVRDRAPGLFIDILRRKAASAGAGMYEYSPFTTALSQTCVCGARKKKPLNMRTHRCGCGVVSDRDRMSAWLGLFVAPVLEHGKPVDRTDLILAQACQDLREDMPGRPRSESPHKQRGSRHRLSRKARARLGRTRGSGDGAARPQPLVATTAHDHTRKGVGTAAAATNPAPTHVARKAAA